MLFIPVQKVPQFLQAGARIRDLLSKNPKQKLELKDHPEGGVFVKDLTNMIVKGAPDLQQVMEALMAFDFLQLVAVSACLSSFSS